VALAAAALAAGAGVVAAGVAVAVGTTGGKNNRQANC